MDKWKNNLKTQGLSPWDSVLLGSKEEKIVTELQNERSENGGKSGVFTVETEL